MKKLFLLDGIAGTGKSDLLEYVHTKRRYDNVIKKYTTRIPRDNFYKEKSDLLFVDKEEFKENKQRYYSFNTYEYGGKQYGFWDEELNASILKYENTFLIIRSKGLYRWDMFKIRNKSTSNFSIYIRR